MNSIHMCWNMVHGEKVENQSMDIGKSMYAQRGS